MNAVESLPESCNLLALSRQCIRELAPNGIDFAGGGGRVGVGSACPPAADASTPDTHGSSISAVGPPRGADPVRVKNKQWTRRVDGLAPRPDPDSGLLFSNWLKFSLKKSCSEESEFVEEDEDMGNLQGGESKKKDVGKSPMKEKKRGFLSKKPAGPKVQVPAPTPPVSVEPPPPEAEHEQAEHHNGARAVDGPELSMADTGTRLFATESWRAVNQVGSRESSSESIFMDPLSSPRVPEAPASVLDDSPLVPPDFLLGASLVPPRSDSPSASLVPLRRESWSISQQPEDSSSLTQQPDDSSSLDDVTLMEDEEEEGEGLVSNLSVSEAVSEPPPHTSHQRPTSFTLNKHRKVELGSITGQY